MTPESSTIHRRAAGAPARPSATRSRWAAIGAAVAVVLGAGGLTIAGASGGGPSSFTAITPERILDTRSGLGLAGPFESPVGRTLQVTGAVPTATGTHTVVPPGATAVVLNVTAVQPQADGFISVRPEGVAGAPTTSNLNFAAGDVVPNAVTVALPATGRIEIVYDAYGASGPTTDVLVDVVALVSDAVFGFAPSDEIVLSHGTAEMVGHEEDVGGLPPDNVVNTAWGTWVSGNGVVMMSLTGPAVLGDVEYRLTSIEYCVDDLVRGQQVTAVWVTAGHPPNGVEHVSPASTAGCHVVPTPFPGQPAAAFGYTVEFLLTSPGGDGDLRFVGVRSTWSPIP